MSGLEINPDWTDIALRLGASAIAGLLIGLNRGERGKPAGLRTTMLVCLSATLAMILGNILINTHGRPADSFVQLDMMRLPLGILTGIGFIGAGTIIKKGDLVTGVTTAATIWYVTVLGLCFGAGHYLLGAIATGLGLVVLGGLSFVENAMKQEHRAALHIDAQGGETGVLTEQDLRAFIENQGYRVASCDTEFQRDGDGWKRCFWMELKWQARRHEASIPAFLKDLAHRPGVIRVAWRMGQAPGH